MFELFKNFFKDEDGLGTVEIVVIIAVLVGIALIFRDAIIKFATGIMRGVFGDESIIDEVNSSNIRHQNTVN
jgi:Flp pilus assembly pilin Flp